MAVESKGLQRSRTQLSNQTTTPGAQSRTLLCLLSHISPRGTEIKTPKCWKYASVGRVCVSCSVIYDSATPGTVACQAPLSMGFSRQEYWSELPFPTPGDFPDPGIKPRSPALQADSSPSELTSGKSNELFVEKPESSPDSSCSIAVSAGQVSFPSLKPEGRDALCA